MINLELGQKKTTSKNIYSDGNARTAEGKYGVDRSSKIFDADGTFYHGHIPLKFGNYDFGSINMHISTSGISFSVTATTGNVAYALINRPLPEYLKERGFDETTVNIIKDQIRSCGVNMNTVMVKDVAIEGPKASIGFGIGKGKTVGAGVSAQISALRFGLETSIGEIDLEFPAGFSLGKTSTQTYTKKGNKPGTHQEETISYAMARLSIRRKEENQETSLPEEKTPATAVTKITKTAEKFVKARAAIPETPSQHHSSTAMDINAMLDEDVRLTAERFDKNGAVKILYQEYQQSADSHKYKTFHAKLSSHLESEKNFNDLIQTAAATSMFFSQVAVLTKNRDLAKGAQALSISTQAFSGFKEIGNCIDLVKAGGLSVASFGSFMTGAGAVLGAFSALSSLFGGGGDDGLGEALAQISQQLVQIHETILDMWKDMSERFEITWQILDKMEENNQKRFELTLKAIRYIHDELTSQAGYQHEVLKGKIDALDHKIEVYLGYLTHRDVRETIKNIRKEVGMIVWKSEDEFKTWVEGIFRPWTVKMEEWLTVTAALENGEIPTRDRRLIITDDGLIDELGKAMSIEHQETNDIRLGLFASLATEIDNQISLTQSAKIINPRGWQYVLEIYQDLWDVCVTKGWPLDEATTNVYIEEMNKIAETANHNFKLIQSIATSELLWKDLVGQYQQNFAKLKLAIKTAQPKLPEGKNLPAEIRWDLTRTAEENMRRFLELPQHQEIARQLTQDVSWIGTLGVRDETLIPIAVGDYHKEWLKKGIPEGDLNFSLSQEQYDSLLGSQEVTDRMSDIKSDMRFALCLLYQLCSTGMAYAPYNVGDYTHYWDYSLYVAPSIKIKNALYPFFHARLFHKNIGSWGGESRFKYGFASDYTQRTSIVGRGGAPEPFARNMGGWSFKFYVRDNFDKIAFHEVIENDLLFPFRKSISKEMFPTETSFRIFSSKLKAAYYKLVAFIQLFDTKFKPTLTPRILLKIENAIQKLSISGSAEDLRQLLEPIEEKTIKSDRTEGELYVWQEELREYLTLEFEPFDSEYLRSKVTARFEEISWVQALKQTPSKIMQLKQALLANPYGVARALESARVAVNDQEWLLYNSFNTVYSSVVVLSSFNGALYTPFLSWKKTLEESYAQEDVKYLPKPTFYESVTFIDESEPKVTSLIHGTELQKLCAGPTVKIEYVEEELKRLSIKGGRYCKEALNELSNVILSPLYLAIQARRDDVVSLLLDYDAIIKEEDFSILDRGAIDPVAQRIFALLDFHRYMQSFSLGEESGRTLSLIRKGIEKIESFSKHHKDGIIFLGKTSAGKSTIINFLLGIEYEYTKEGLKLKQGHTEKTSTSSSATSETTYPEIFEYDNFLIVDMPGFVDTRGDSYETAAGVTTQMLKKVVKNLRAIVLVCKTSHIEERGKDLIDVFNNYGAIIGRSLDNMGNVLIIINCKKSEIDEWSIKRVISKFQEIASTSQDLTEDAIFFMEQLKPNNILLTNLLSHAFRQEFLSAIKQKTSTSTTSFKLESFHRHVEGFKKLACRLEAYMTTVINDYNSITAAMALEQQEKFSSVKENLESETFLSQVNYNKPMPPFETSERNNLNQQLANQILQKDYILNKFLAPIIEAIRLNYNNQNVSRIGSLQDVKQLELRAQIANTFLQKVSAIGLARSSDCPLSSTTIHNNVETAEIQADGSQSRGTGSFFIPGAAGAEIDMTHYLQDENGFWFYQPPVLLSLSSRPEIIKALTKTFSSPELRLFNGKVQPSCAYQWRSIFKLVLPKTTHISNGNSFGNYPMAFCSEAENHIEFTFLKDGVLRLSQNKKETYIELELGTHLTNLANYGYRTFGVGVVEGFTHRSLRKLGINEKRSQSITHFIYITLMYNFYGLSAMIMHIFPMCLKSTLRLSDNQARNISFFMAIFMSAIQAEELSKVCTIMLLIAQMSLGIFGYYAGQKTGVFLSESIFGNERELSSMIGSKQLFFDRNKSISEKIDIENEKMNNPLIPKFD